MIVDFDNEIADIVPEAEGLIYHLEREGRFYSEDEICLLMEMFGVPSNLHSNILDYLIYYGIFGIKENNDDSCSDAVYIYDVGYNSKRINALVQKMGSALKYVINPALFDFAQRNNADDNQHRLL